MSANADLDLLPDTFELERTFTAAPDEVFAAYADCEARSVWGPPPTDEMRYSRSEFRVGGTDEYHCGPAGDLRMSGRAVYLDIVENERIVFAETVSTEGRVVAHSLVSWHLEQVGSATKVAVLVQIVSYVGEWMLTASRGGRATALDNLEQHLVLRHRPAGAAAHRREAVRP